MRGPDPAGTWSQRPPAGVIRRSHFESVDSVPVL